MQSREWNRVAQNVNFNLDLDWEGFSQRISSNSNILDFGCGYGRVVERLTTLGYGHIEGIDSSKEFINRGKELYPHLELHHSTGTIPYEDESFDAVILCAVLTCIPQSSDRDLVLTEIYRVLKRGGILHLVEFCRDETKVFTSSLGVQMVHSCVVDLKEDLVRFQNVESKVITTETMRGTPIQAFSYFGQKG